MVYDPQRKQVARILRRAGSELKDARDSALSAYTTLDKILNIPQTAFNPRAEFGRVGQVLDSLEESMRTLAEKEVEVTTGQPASPEKREQIKRDLMKARLRR